MQTHYVRYKLSISKLLVGGFYISCLFPFISPIPIQTDTQPVFLVFAVAVVFLKFLHIGVLKHELILLYISGLSLIYINPQFEYNLGDPKSLAIIVGVITFIAARQINSQRAYQLARWAALVYFIYSCLIYLNTNFFLGLQSHFVRAINVASDGLGYRGAPALATEPGLLGGLLVFLLIQLQYYGKKVGTTPKEIAVYGFVIVLTIIMTKSGTGYLYLLTFLILNYYLGTGDRLFIRIFLTFLIFMVLAIGISFLANLELNNRGVQILITLISGDILDADTSVLKRLYDIRIGVASLFDYPFGVGINAVNATVNEVAVRHNLLRVNDLGNQISLVSGLSFYLVAYGMLGLLFLIYIFFFVSRAPHLHKLFAFIFLLASYSPAFPAIWILLSQFSDEKKVGRKLISD